MVYSALHSLGLPLNALPFYPSLILLQTHWLFLEHAEHAAFSGLYSYCFFCLNVLTGILKVGILYLLKPLLRAISQSTSKVATLPHCPLASIVTYLFVPNKWKRHQEHVRLSEDFQQKPLSDHVWNAHIHLLCVRFMLLKELVHYLMYIMNYITDKITRKLSQLLGKLSENFITYL